MLTFWPNIVGYTRVILLLSSFFYLHSNHRRALLLYGVSFFLDVVDGPLARALGQSSRFGALLDMMTDKFSSPSLLNALSTRHPSMAPLLVGCLVLDVASHLMHLQATALAGVRSHKETKPRWTLVRWFYEVKPFFIWCCLGHEIFLVALYWLSFEQQQALDGSRGPVVLPASWWAPVAEAVGALVKSALGESAADLFELVVGAGAAEAAAAGGGGGGPAAFGETAGAAGEEGQGHGEGLRLVNLVALLCLPAFACKTLVHAAQLCNAGEAVALIDASERRAARHNQLNQQLDQQQQQQQQQERRGRRRSFVDTDDEAEENEDYDEILERVAAAAPSSVTRRARSRGSGRSPSPRKRSRSPLKQRRMSPRKKSEIEIFQYLSR